MKRFRFLVIGCFLGWAGLATYDSVTEGKYSEIPVLGFFLKDKAVSKERLLVADTTAGGVPLSDSEEVGYGSAGEVVVIGGGAPSLVEAAERSKESVVFIRTITEAEYMSGGWMGWFFGKPEKVATGSGVFYSEDGYVVTNDHVVRDADLIEVIHRKRKYSASLIGSDPSTDIAVVKIEGSAFPAITLGDSDKVRLGEWVLAVGNPFNLASTITAGIVSAKGRNINILKDRFPIESFIQTDAAINPGNSGGALVNSEGDLIGINTAIFSRTGYYTGYGFAIPVNIVEKVVNDVIKYGQVQKAYVGVSLREIDSELAEERGFTTLDGVLVARVQADGAAEKAGLKEGDVLLQLNGKEVQNSTQVEEMVGYAYPGDKMSVVLRRQGRTLNKTLTLLNREGTVEVIRRTVVYSKVLGADLEVVPKIERDALGVTHGVRIHKLKPGLLSRLNIPQGFIITRINRRNTKTVKDIEGILSKVRGKVVVEGVDRGGKRLYYSYYMRR